MFTNTLQASQDLEFFTVNNMSQNLRMHSRTVGLSGNGQFFRLKPVVAALICHPWGHALLDDYEMTVKLMMKGITIDYIGACWVYQQAVIHVRAFIKQRSRWVQGNLDILR